MPKGNTGKARRLRRAVFVGPVVLGALTVLWLMIALPEVPEDPILERFTARIGCPYQSLEDLSDEERYPRAGERHMVDPPSGGNVTLVCCQTTKGPWNIVVREAWAPRGARRFLEMVTSGYFGHKVPLMRCVRNFLCQFGLAGEISQQFGSRLEDDPNWLPEGKQYRENENGVKRFAQGYFAYAGAGSASRTQQLIVALKGNGPLGGGSPWEVPWGELVGKHSFLTLSKIYTGYGENGPPQSKLHHAGALELVAHDFPLLDMIVSCQVQDEEDQT